MSDNIQMFGKMLPGKAGGKPFPMRSNLYPVKTTSNDSVILYDVKFSPDIIPKIRGEIFYAGLLRASANLPPSASFHSRLFFDGVALAFSVGKIVNFGSVTTFYYPKSSDMDGSIVSALINTYTLPPTANDAQKLASLEALKKAVPATTLHKPSPASLEAMLASPIAISTLPTLFPKIMEKISTMLIQITVSEAQSFSLGAIESYTKSKSMTEFPSTLIQGLDIILRESLRKHLSQNDPLAVVSHGRSIFSCMEKGIPLGSGVRLISGYYQSLRLLEGGMYLNVDTAWLPSLPSGSLVDYLVEATNSKDMSNLSKIPPRTLSSYVRGVKVRGTYSYRRKYTLSSISSTTARTHTFDANSVKTTVEQYFKTVYQVTLKYPNLPCVLLQNGSALPMELLEIVPGQRYNEDLNAEQLTNMLDAAVVPPFKKLESAAKLALTYQLPYNPKISPASGVLEPKSSGMAVQKECLTVNARILPPPTITAKKKGGLNNLPVMASTWRFDDRKQGQSQFIDPKVMGNSILIISERSRCQDDKVKALFDMLTTIGKDYGMTITAPSKRFTVKTLAELEKCFEGPAPAFVYGIFAKSDPLYNNMKRILESKVGIPSQGFNVQKIFKLSPTYVSNILLKINAKLGGINFEAQSSPGKYPFLLDAPTIIFGADVYHCTQGSDQFLSHAAIVASQNLKGSSYAGVAMQHPARTECIPADNMKKAAGFLIKNFAAKTKKIPTRIIFYRDGDANQRNEDFIRQEISAIIDAYKSLYDGKVPEILMITAVKRHHVRFDPLDKRNTGPSPGNGDNPMCGTVIDTGAVRPDVTEFYLYSHPGLKGTSRPTLYQVVLCSVKNITLDNIQELTYFLAHNYQRSCRAVSLPVPVYYAHVMAARTRVLDPNNGSFGDSNKWTGQLSGKLVTQPFYL